MIENHDAPPRSMESLQDSHWWWRGMRYLYTSALDRSLKTLASRRRLIEVGCGYGANLATLGKYGDVVGLDASLDALRAIKTRPALGLVQAHADALPFRAGTFDVVALLAVIEHVEHHEVALEESYRVSRPNAIQLLLTSAFMLLWSHHDVANEHHRRYRRGALNRLLNGAQWHKTYTSYINMMIFPAVAAVRFLQRRSEPTESSIYDMGPTFGPLNPLLEAILKLEAWLVTALRIRLPFGVDLFSVARRDPNDK